MPKLRETAPCISCRRNSCRGRLLPLLRRCRPLHNGTLCRGIPTRLYLHVAAGSRGSDWLHCPLELPAHDGRLETGPRTCRRKHRGSQGIGIDPADRPTPRPDLGGSLSIRRDKYCNRSGNHHRPSPHFPSPRPHGFTDRKHRHRHPCLGERSIEHQANPLGIGGQSPGHRI